MKKILFMLLFTGAMFSQELKQVPKQILEIQSRNENFTKVSLFEINENFDLKKIEKEVDGATVVTLNQSALVSVVSQKPNYLQFSLPYNNKLIDVVLYKVQIEAADFRVDTDKQQNVIVEKGVHYRGIINGNVNSIISFNFFKDDVNGIVSESDFNNLNIGKLTASGNVSDYIIYSDLNLKKPFNFICDAKDAPETNSSTAGREVQTTNSTKCVAIYFELDYSNYVARGQNVATATTWFSSLFNNIQTLYANDGISTAIKSLFIWTTPDPYIGGETSRDFLFAFEANRPVFNGDIAQLVCLNAGNLGGVAYLNGLCGARKHGFSDIQNTFSTVPQYSWNVEVITHELGHQMGSQHTHACAWNGNNTAIDGCAPTFSATLSEGDCPIGPVPSVSVRGTIMSYCHLLNVGINFANGFGPQPAARILGYVNGGSCLSTDCINTCINTVTNFSVTNVTQTSAVLQFTDLDATATRWQVAAVPYPYSTPTWITVNSNPYTFTNLVANTYYKFMVKGICPAGLTASSNGFKFGATDPVNVCAGVTFRDTSPLSTYGNDEDWTRTYTPSAGLKAKVTFTTLNLENEFDYLYIHDGSNINAPLLASLTGSQSNISFQATNATGALTFHFVSDQAETASGWNATISCQALGINDFGVKNYSYYPNPVTNELIVESKSEIEKIEIYSIDGKLIFKQAQQIYNTKINTAAFAKGTYIVRVAFAEGSNDAFKIVKE